MTLATKHVNLLSQIVFSTALLIAVAVLIANTPVRAQDKIVLGSRTLEGKVEKIADGKVHFISDGAAAATPFPETSVKEIIWGDRKEYKDGISAMAEGDYDKAASLLKPLVDNLLGADVPWVAEAAGAYAEVLAETGKIYDSEQICKEIVEKYVGKPYALKGELGLARIDLAQKRYDVAIQKLAEIEKKTPKMIVPDERTMSILSTLYFAKGEALAATGKNSEALHSYLLVSTIYYKPAKRAKEAQDRADELRKSDGNLVVN